MFSGFQIAILDVGNAGEGRDADNALEVVG
jgi:hypothetical protein